MKLTKVKLIQAIKPGLEKLGYLYLKDSISGAQGLFGKKITNEMYLTLGLTIHRFYDDAFTGSFYLSKTTEWAACYGDIPKECYKRPGYFLSKEELDSMNQKAPDIWWSGLNEESVASFINLIQKTESLFLSQDGLIEKIENSTDVDILYKRSLWVKRFVANKIPDIQYNFLPQKNIDNIPIDWFKAAEIVLAECEAPLKKQAVKNLAADAYRQYLLDMRISS